MSDTRWMEKQPDDYETAAEPEMKTTGSVLAFADAIRRKIKLLEKQRSAIPIHRAGDRVVIDARIRELRGDLKAVLQVMDGGDPEKIETRSRIG